MFWQKYLVIMYLVRHKTFLRIDLIFLLFLYKMPPNKWLKNRNMPFDVILRQTIIYFFSFAHYESINRWNHFKSLETTSNIYGKQTKLAKDNYEIEVIDQYSREALLFFRAVREYQNISFHTHTPYYALRNCYSLWNMNTILSMLSFWFMGSYSTWKLVWKCLSNSQNEFW